MDFTQVDFSGVDFDTLDEPTTPLTPSPGPLLQQRKTSSPRIAIIPDPDCTTETAERYRFGKDRHSILSNFVRNSLASNGYVGQELSSSRKKSAVGATLYDVQVRFTAAFPLLDRVKLEKKITRAMQRIRTDAAKKGEVKLNEKMQRKFPGKRKASIPLLSMMTTPAKKVVVTVTEVVATGGVSDDEEPEEEAYEVSFSLPTTSKSDSKGEMSD